MIGSRGSNWPVFDGKDQIGLIKTSYNSAPAAPRSPRGRSENHYNTSSRNVSPSKRHIKDPYASLDLFSPKPAEENQRSADPNPVAPRASARPTPREMSELFAAGHEDHEPGSPKKAPADTVVAPKAGTSQKFAPPRLFSDDKGEPAAVGYKSNPAKYNHFDLGDSLENDPMQHRENAPQARTAVPLRAKSNRNQSQWDFEDFSTPGKAGQKVRGQDVVHFSWDDNANNCETPGKNLGRKQRRDNETHFELQDDGTPIERHVVPKPRKDAETHFQLNDTATPAPDRAYGRPSSSRGGQRGLYANNVYDEAEEGKSPGKAPLSTITTNTHRTHDFDNHFSMADVSPAVEKTHNENHPRGDNPKKAAYNMGAHWGAYDQSPEQVTKAPTHSRLRKGLESHWTIGEEETNTTGAPGTINDRGQPVKSFWDF